MINLITSLSSSFNTVPSQKQILKMVSQLSDELKENFSWELKKNGINDMMHLDSMLKNLFLDVYVDRGIHNRPSNKELHDFIRNEHTDLHQWLMLRANEYVHARDISLQG